LKDIPITKPHFTDREKELIQKPVESGWVVQGRFVEQFENTFAEFAGVPHAAATTSCTTALHLAVRAMGVESGDEVIVPAFTWVATANVVEYENGTPVFCDVDPDMFNIDPARIEDKVTENTVGIIPVHLFGLCANMAEIQEIADQHDLWIIEDAACALGGRIDGQHAGTFGNAGCFSFHPRKSITTGEGGIITTGSDELNEQVRSLRDHGATRTDLERHESSKGFFLPDYPHVGYNYRMTDVQGALGCAQMEKVDEILDARRTQAKRYHALLEDVPGIKPPITPENYTHGYQAYVCRFEPEEPSLTNVDELHTRRNQLMTDLEQQGIATRPGTHSAAHTEYYSDTYGIQPADFPEAYLAEKITVTLPMYVGLSEEDQERVVETIQEGLRD